jgi:hypothetical protein
MVDIDHVTTGELLEAWRDATRAAELAERLAQAALRAADRADRDSATAQEIATMADEAAEAAERAARVAREAARRAANDAIELRAEVGTADQGASTARGTESDAKGRYHEAEDAARNKYSDGATG